MKKLTIVVDNTFVVVGIIVAISIISIFFGCEIITFKGTSLFARAMVLWGIVSIAGLIFLALLCGIGFVEYRDAEDGEKSPNIFFEE